MTISCGCFLIALRYWCYYHALPSTNYGVWIIIGLDPVAENDGSSSRFANLLKIPQKTGALPSNPPKWQLMARVSGNKHIEVKRTEKGRRDERFSCYSRLLTDCLRTNTQFHSETCLTVSLIPLKIMLILPPQWCCCLLLSHWNLAGLLPRILLQALRQNFHCRSLAWLQYY